MTTEQEQNKAMLMQYLQGTINPDAAVRKEAEGYLGNVQCSAGFQPFLLSVVGDATVNPSVRQAVDTVGAVYFKNSVKFKWTSYDESEASIPEQDKAHVRSAIIDMMLDTPRAVQAQLSTAVTLMAEFDFPSQWPSLVEELAKRLDQQNLERNYMVLETLHAIFKRYRHQFKTEALFEEIKWVLHCFEKPMFVVFQHYMTAMKQGAGAQKEKIMDCLSLLVKIYASLNSQDVPEFFEDNNATYFTGFHELLQLREKADDDDDDFDDEPGALQKLQTAVCEAINLYIEKYEEDFQPYVEQFLKDVWELLICTGRSLKYDGLFISAAGFLTSVSKSVEANRMRNVQLLQTLSEKIILPNVELRESELDAFVDNPIEYIRRDQEKADAETRRSAASELLKALMDSKIDKNDNGTQSEFNTLKVLTEITVKYIEGMLQKFSANPDSVEGVRCYDSAIFLIESLSTKTQTSLQGITSVNEFMPLGPIFDTYIMPVLTQHADNLSLLSNSTVHRCLLQSDCIRFVTSFRRQLPGHYFSETVLPSLVKCLKAENVVVHTYAAIALDKFFSVKDQSTPGQPRTLRYGTDIMKVVIEPLVKNLFGMMRPGVAENEFLMRTFMRVVIVAGNTLLQQYTGECVAKVTEFLSMAAQGSEGNTAFNHYMFEALATLVRNNATAEQSVASFESALFPHFGTILQNDIVDLVPYILQIFSQLLTQRRKLDAENLPASYQSLFPNFLHVNFWQRSANIPALTKLMEVFLLYPKYLVENAKATIEPLLGIFQKLIASKLNDQYGISIISSMVFHLPADVLQSYVPAVFRILLTRLQSSRTSKFIRGMVTFFSVFVCKHGGPAFYSVMDSIQPNLLAQLSRITWVAEGPKITKKEDRKVVAVAMTRMLFETNLWLENEAYRNSAADMLAACAAVANEQDVLVDDESDDDAGEELDLAGYSTTFSELVFTQDAATAWDAAADVPSTGAYFTAKLKEKLADSSSAWHAVVKGMAPEGQQSLKKVAALYGLTM